MNRIEQKKLAKKQISGNILMIFLASLIVCAISSLSSALVLGPLLLTPVLCQGLILIYLDVRDNNEVNLARLFDPFKDFSRVWCTYFLSGLFAFLWSLLFIIPGIIKSYSYSMAPYIIAENPEITAGDAIKESMRIMEGHKWELFVLKLSFIGWILLGIITFGIAFIYVDPYMNMSVVNFYDNIKNN